MTRSNAVTDRRLLSTDVAARGGRFRLEASAWRGVGILLLAWNSSALAQLPAAPGTVMDFSNLKWDGEPCKAVSIAYDETTTKPMSGVPSYPVGTRVLGIRAICGKSPRPREFMRLQKN